MGLRVYKPSNSQIDMGNSKRCPNTEKEVDSPNPNPTNYQIIKSEQVGHALIVMIQYPDCTNYEGKKICVFRCTLEELMNQKAIDPHFSDNNDDQHYPYARLKPTKYGWELAFLIADRINQDYENQIRAEWGIFG